MQSRDGIVTVCDVSATRPQPLCPAGASGDGTCACKASYAGHACQHLCPGAPIPCHGHGACNALGRCVCTGPFAGVNCTECATGYHGPDCGRPCAHGVSVERLCLCHEGWAGPDCATECAGGSLWPCNGHGQCRDGTTGDGSCVCAAGWAGPACALPCGGGAATPCSGHGVCRAEDGGCVCYADEHFGHWTGMRGGSGADACGTRAGHGLVANFAFSGGGGGVRGQKNFMYLKSTSNFGPF